MNVILAMALESDEHPDHTRAGGQGATLTSYFHTRQRSRSITEEIQSKAKAISEGTFETRWKSKEVEMRNQIM